MNDSISRQDAIDAINKFWINGTSLCEADKLTEEIINMPSANQWTPCSEGLPHKIETYIVCTEKGSIFLARWEGNMFTTKGKVLAWMPKPKPWKGEK